MYLITETIIVAFIAVTIGPAIALDNGLSGPAPNSGDGIPYKIGDVVE
jgi:hypothetical protein